MERVIPAVGGLSFGFRANAAGPMIIGTTGAAFFMRPKYLGQRPNPLIKN
jgi:hypothetical protein